MATANENIRDALVKHQIMLVKQSGKVSREILAMLDDAHGDLKKRIDDRLRAIADSGQDTGEATTRRLLALERSLRAILRRPHRRINARVRKALKDIAINDPKIVSQSIKAGLPVVVTNTVPSASQLRAIVETMPVDGTPLKTVLGDLETGTVEAIMAGVRRGLTLGEGIAALRQRVRKALDTTKKRAEAIVRTAANAASNRARQFFFKENKKVIKWLVWVATLDSRTCVYCGAQDGKLYRIDKGPRPPAHLNCRCAMVASVDGNLIGDRPLKRSTEEDLLAEYAEQVANSPLHANLDPKARVLSDKEKEKVKDQVDELLHGQDATEQAQDLLAPVGRFIGRDRAFYMLEQALGIAPVTLLSGVGGTGKTELAKAFARWLQQTGWAEGVVFHSFEPGVATFGLDGLVSAVGLRLLGPDFIGKTGGKAEQQALLLQILKQHRIVLVLDNFETVRSMPDPTGATPSLDEAASAELKAFFTTIHEGAESLVLITSRSEEDWLGEINRLTIGGLDAAEVHEFADDLLAGKPDAQQRRQDKAFGELLTMLHGHPLSLRLLLPQLTHRDAKALIAGLKGQKPLPDSERRDPGRLDSLDASVAYSLDQLDAQDRSRLLILCLFEGVVDADVLAVFSKEEQAPDRFQEISRDDWVALLDRVIDLGLLSGLGLGGYRLHPALPSYLLRAWQDQAGDAFAEEQEAAELALIHATAAFGQWLNSEIETGRAELAMALMDLQRRSLGRVLGEALARELYDPAQYIMQSLNEYWNARGLVAEADSWVERIRLAIEDDQGAVPDFESEAGALWLFAVGSQANRLQRSGRLDEAEAVHREIAQILEQSTAPSARRHLAIAYHQLGIVAQHRGSYELAEDWYKKSLAIKEELGNRPHMASSYHQLGMVAQARGSYELAEDWYKKSLAILEELGNRPGMAKSYGQLGMLEEARGNDQAVLDWIVRCNALFPEFPHPATGPGPGNLARLARDLGMETLEASWLRCTGQRLPNQVRNWVNTKNAEMAETA